MSYWSGNELKSANNQVKIMKSGMLIKLLKKCSLKNNNSYDTYKTWKSKQSPITNAQCKKNILTINNSNYHNPKTNVASPEQINWSKISHFN